MITVQMPNLARGHSFQAHALSLEIDREGVASGKAGTADVNIGVGRLGALHLVREQDGQSPTLARFAISGSSVGTVTVDVGDGGKPYLTITLERAFVRSWKLGGDSGGRPTEDLALVGNIIRMRTTDANASDFSWDVGRAAPAR